MNRVAEWLSQTSLSLTIQSHEWIIPTLQSIHIIAIAVVLGSVSMIDFRILGWAGRDQTLTETTERYGPWLSWGLCVLLVTGAAMIVGEPARQLLALSFWLKMGFVAIATVTAVSVRRSIARHGSPWEIVASRPAIRALAIVTLLIWVCIVVLGRLIAYDYVWGSWSEALKR